MVLKKRKPGACKVNTGRTIRNGPHHNSRNRYAFVTYSKDGPVEVAVRGDERLKGVLAVLPSEDVEYSLKKKGRWQISDFLKRQVMPDVYDAEYEVKLCEHYHQLGCKDPCTGKSSDDLSSRNVMLAHRPYSAVPRWERFGAAPAQACQQPCDAVTTPGGSVLADGSWTPSGWLSFNIVHGVRDDSSAAFVKAPRTVKQGKKSKERTVGKREALDEALGDYLDSVLARDDCDDDNDDDYSVPARRARHTSTSQPAPAPPKTVEVRAPPKSSKAHRRPIKYRRRKAH